MRSVHRVYFANCTQGSPVMLQRYKYIFRVALDVKSLTAENEILEKNYEKAAGEKVK